MFSRVPRLALAGSAALLGGSLVLTGCSNDSNKTTTPASSAAPTTSTTTSAAPTASEASPTATETSPSATTSATQNAPATGDLNLTPAQMNAALAKVTVNGAKLTAVPESEVTKINQSLSSQMVQLLNSAKVTPASCKTATLESAKNYPATARTSMAATNSGVVVAVREMPSGAAAQATRNRFEKASQACKSYSMEIGSGSSQMKITSTQDVVDVPTSVVSDAVGSTSKITQSSGTTSSTTVMGTSGNLLLQVTQGSASANKQSMAKVMDDVVKALRAAG